MCSSDLFKACLNYERWDDFIKSMGHTFVVDINVYSLKNHADKIGSILSGSGIFLQLPVHNWDETIYYNPQVLEFDGFQEKPDENPRGLIGSKQPLVRRSVSGLVACWDCGRLGSSEG